MGMAQNFYAGVRDLACFDNAAFDGVIQIMIQVGHNIGNADDVAFHRTGHFIGIVGDNFAISLGVLQNPVANLIRQVQSFAVHFKYVDNAQTLLVM